MKQTNYPFHDLSGPGDEDVVPAEGAAQRIGVIFSARSHHNKGREPEFGDRSDVAIVRPETRGDIARALRDFARNGIGLLVISGGDGTVRDVLTMGQGVFQNGWPQLALLPRGKTNALNVDLGSPRDWTLAAAIKAFESPTGRRVIRRPLSVTRVDSDEPPMLGFIMGAGAFAMGVAAGQDAHKAGFFNSLAVGVTSVWGVAEAVVGRDDNRWRRGARMDLLYRPSNEAMPRSPYGDPARRMLMLASTLDTMPLGIKLFGKRKGGIRLAILDHPRRRLLLSIPAVLAGWHPHWLGPAGLHHLQAEAFSLDIDAPFILDGESFAEGRLTIEQGPELTFVAG